MPMMRALPVIGYSSARRRAAAGSCDSTSVMACASARERPAATPAVIWARSVIGSAFLRVGQQVARDHHALDLRRALADGAELHVAVVLLGRELFDEAVAAEDLHAFF